VVGWVPEELAIDPSRGDYCSFLHQLTFKFPLRKRLRDREAKSQSVSVKGSRWLGMKPPPLCDDYQGLTGSGSDLTEQHDQRNQRRPAIKQACQEASQNSGDHKRRNSRDSTTDSISRKTKPTPILAAANPRIARAPLQIVNAPAADPQNKEN
jgi:hypothetical protein